MPGQLFFFFQGENTPHFAHWTPPLFLPHFMQDEQRPPHQYFPWHCTAPQRLYGATCGVRARKRLTLTSRLDNEVYAEAGS